jgi:hypothetical protein
MKSLAFVALCLGACSQAPDEGIEIVPVVLNPQLDATGAPIPGTLLIDTSEGRMDLTSLIPDQPREFASWDEVHRWATEHLNARVTEDAQGERSSMVSAGYGPTVRYDAALDDMVPVEDPIVAMLGGTSGQMIVGGKAICIDPKAACAGPSRVRISNREIQTNNGLTIDGATGIFRIPGYIEVKTSTSLVASTKIRTVGCGFLRWCIVYDAPVSLSAYITAYGGPNQTSTSMPRREAVMNTTAVAAALVGFGGGDIFRTDGACGYANGSDTVGSISIKLADGYLPQYGQCP